MRPCVSTNGAAASTPDARRTSPSTLRQSSSSKPSPYVRTRRWGFATRILSRRSAWSPFITPSTTMSAMTPTVTPPTAMTEMSERRRVARLLRWIVQLAERVGELALLDEQIPSLHARRIAALELGERRQRHRIVQHEGRLDQRGLDVVLEDLVHELRPRQLVSVGDVLPLQRRPQLGFARARQVDPGRLAHQGVVVLTRERALEVERRAVPLERRGPEQLLHHPREHLLRALQHHLVVGIGLVPLGHGELGIVEAVHPLVAEVVPDLIHLFQPAHDAALEIQFVGDPQIHIRVERLVVRDERPRRGAAVHRLQHRGLHLEVPPRVEELPDVADHAGPQPEYLPHLRVHRQVGVALAGAQLGIRQLPVPLALRILLAERQGAQRLGEEGAALDPDGDLAGLGAKQRPLHADHVAQIEQLHEVILLGPDGVDLEVDLNLPGAVLQVTERRLAHGAQQNEPPGEPVDGRVVFAESLERRLDRAGAVETIGEWDDTALYELGELLPPRRLDEAGHAALLPKRLRYASMNGSKSPSITRWTSATFSSVRWSFTMV